MMLLTNDLPVPVQPWKDITRGFLGRSKCIFVLRALRTIWIARCWPKTFRSKSLFITEGIRGEKSQKMPYYSSLFIFGCSCMTIRENECLLPSGHDKIVNQQGTQLGSRLVNQTLDGIYGNQAV